MSRLFLVRHGQTDWNASARLQGATDIPLNEVGIEQAHAVAAALANVVVGSTTVKTSTLSRAHGTASIIADALGVDVDPDQRLIERSYGIWEGTTHEERMAEHPEQVERWRAGGEPTIEGYESQERLMTRMQAALEQAVGSATGDVVVVSHGSAIRAGVLALTGISSSPSQAHAVVSGLHNAHWAELTRGVEGWHIDRYNAGPQLIAHSGGTRS